MSWVTTTKLKLPTIEQRQFIKSALRKEKTSLTGVKILIEGAAIKL